VRYEEDMTKWFRPDKSAPGTWILTLWVQPRASRTEVVGVHALPEGQALKVRVAAPPVEGAANDEILRFLKKKLGTGVQVELLRGATGRSKEARVSGSHLDDKWIEKLLGE
jgi:uncharacterized protein (TIGR00251 family)